VRYVLPITVGIVTATVTMRSAGLSWSHDTCCFALMEKLNPFPMRAYRNTSVAEVDDVVWCAHGATHRQDAFLEEAYVTGSPMPGRAGSPPLDASHS
jgi:hypothetical protein